MLIFDPPNTISDLKENLSESGKTGGMPVNSTTRQLDHVPTRPLEDTNSTPACQLDNAPTLTAGSGGASLMHMHRSSHASKPMRETSESHMSRYNA